MYGSNGETESHHIVLDITGIHAEGLREVGQSRDDEHSQETYVFDDGLASEPCTCYGTPNYCGTSKYINKGIEVRTLLALDIQHGG